MRFAGIDVGSRTHMLAIVDESLRTLLKPTTFDEDAAGYEKLRKLLGEPSDYLVVLEATGHYGNNLFVSLVGWNFSVAVLNPLRTRRFAEEDLQRAKTDTIDALGIARFGASKRPAPTIRREPALEQLRECVRLRTRLVQDFGDRTRQLHRLIDLSFPEFTRYVQDPGCDLARTVLLEYPTAEAIRAASVRQLAALRDGRKRRVGATLARSLFDAAKVSVGQHQGIAYARQVQYTCQDLGTLARTIRNLDVEIETSVEQHVLGPLLRSIDGIGLLTIANILATVGDPARFRSADALAAYIGVVPGTRQSGLWRPGSSRLCPIGNARLRKALWMPTLAAVRRNPWLAQYYQRLRSRGKPPKVALIAAMRKLVCAIYSVAKHRKPFVPRLT